MPIYRVETDYGTWACTDTVSGQLRHGPDRARAALLLSLRAGACLVLGQVAAGPDGAPRLSLNPLRIRLGAEPGMCSLIEPVSGLLLQALPPAAGGKEGLIAPGGTRTGPGERFRLHVAELAPGSLEWSVLQELEAAAAAAPRTEDVVAELACDPPLHPVSLLRALLIASPWQPEGLAALLLANPVLMARMAGPEDPWLAFGMAELARWLVSREPGPARRQLGPDLDGLAEVYQLPQQLGQVCSAALRGAVPPRRRACVLATARNEGVYLLEWIAYHQALGFEHFFLYSNDNDDGSDAMLAALAAAGVITWIDSVVAAPIPPQYKAYRHALSLLPDILNYEWVFIADIDEFLVLDRSRFATVHDYIEWQSVQEVDAIALNWLMYGTFGALRYDPARLLTERFTIRHAGVNPHIKCLCRPRRFDDAQAHYPRAAPGMHPVFRDSEGDPYQPLPQFAHAANPKAASAWVNHYWSKSLDELLVKFARNRGDGVKEGRRPALQIAIDIGERVLAVERNPAATEHDNRIRACAPGLRDGIEHLLALPGMRDAAHQVASRFCATAAQIRAEILALDPAQMTPSARETRDLLHENAAPLTMGTIGEDAPVPI